MKTAITDIIIYPSTHPRVCVCIWQEDFEAPFLETTRLFYRAESQGFIARNTCPDYMLKVPSVSFIGVMCVSVCTDIRP